MVGLTSWIQKTFTRLVDPDKEARLEHLVQLLTHGIHTQQQAFNIEKALTGEDYLPVDLETAKQTVFRKIVARGWQDGYINASEQQTMRWIVVVLNLDAEIAWQINLEFARESFAVALGQAMEDGVLDTDEEARLMKITASTGLELGEFSRRFFLEEGEQFLASVFNCSIADRQISEEEWRRLIETTQKLGLGEEELHDAIRPQAERFVEHVLADAKEDGCLTDSEEITLVWLVNNLGLPSGYQQYVHRQLGKIRKAGTPEHCIPREVRQAVWETQSGTCATCAATDHLEYDHIVSLAQGGDDSESNIRLLCHKCKQEKLV